MSHGDSKNVSKLMDCIKLGHPPGQSSLDGFPYSRTTNVTSVTKKCNFPSGKYIHLQPNAFL